MTKIKEKNNFSKMIQKSKITNKNVLNMLYSISNYIKDLKFDQAPDYDYLKEQIETTIEFINLKDKTSINKNSLVSVESCSIDRS